jgi:uncharacterized Zn-finger protein
MEIGNIKGVLCPCCKEVLYRLSLQESDGIWVKTTDSPPIHNDNEGNFITCPHCSKRIAMAPVIGDLSRGAFEIAQDQKCILP